MPHVWLSVNTSGEVLELEGQFVCGGWRLTCVANGAGVAEGPFAEGLRADGTSWPIANDVRSPRGAVNRDLA